MQLKGTMFLVSLHEDISLSLSPFLPPSSSLLHVSACKQHLRDVTRLPLNPRKPDQPRRTCTVRAACRIFTSPPLQTYACGVFEKISTRVLLPSLFLSFSTERTIVRRMPLVRPPAGYLREERIDIGRCITGRQRCTANR